MGVFLSPTIFGIKNTRFVDDIRTVKCTDRGNETFLLLASIVTQEKDTVDDMRNIRRRKGSHTFSPSLLISLNRFQCLDHSFTTTEQSLVGNRLTVGVRGLGMGHDENIGGTPYPSFLLF